MLLSNFLKSSLPLFLGRRECHWDHICFKTLFWWCIVPCDQKEESHLLIPLNISGNPQHMVWKSSYSVSPSSLWTGLYFVSVWSISEEVVAKVLIPQFGQKCFVIYSGHISQCLYWCWISHLFWWRKCRKTPVKVQVAYSLYINVMYFINVFHSVYFTAFQSNLT